MSGIEAFIAAQYDRLEQNVRAGLHDAHRRGCDAWDYAPDEPGKCSCDVPAYLLADIASKRAILAGHEHELTKRHRTYQFDPFTGEPETGDEFEVECKTCGWAGDDPSSGCMTVRLLAAPFSGQAGYNRAWSLSS